MSNPAVRSGLSVCLLIAGVIGLGAWFQTQAQKSPDAVTPTIRVSTHLVLVDVVVTDKQGKAVKGLNAEEFAVQEKGKTQKIAFFEPPPEAEGATPQAMQSGVYSNRPQFVSGTGPLKILLLDAANTPFKDQAYARLQMLRYVKEQLKSGQRMAVFTLTNNLGVLQDFTSDPKMLLAALENYMPQEQQMGKGLAPPVSAAAGGTELRGGSSVALDVANAQLQSFQNVQVAYESDRRTETTLAAMRSLARILGGIPGRKSVVWITAGFPFSLIPEERTISQAELDESLPSYSQMGVGTRSAGSNAATARTSHAQEIRDAAAQLSSSQVAIYPVDARGLASGMEFTSDDSSGHQLSTVSDGAQIRISDISASQDTMREIATETGGKAYVNQNDIKDGVAVADSDNAASYTIGYYPEDKKWDGKYRSIKVKVSRDAVQTRCRRGYYAVDPSQLKNRKGDVDVAEAAKDKLPDTLITFLAAVRPPENGKVRVIFQVDTDTISTEDASSGSKKMDLDFFATIVAPNGRVLSSKGTKVNQTFAADVYQQIQQKGMQVMLELDAQPGKDNEVRLAVRDNRTGYIGSLLAKLQ
jgi:VWFA-related protein